MPPSSPPPNITTTPLTPAVGARIDKRCVRTVRRVVLVLVQVPEQDVELHHVLWSLVSPG